MVSLYTGLDELCETDVWEDSIVIIPPDAGFEMYR